MSALVGTRSYKDAFPKQKVLALLRDQAERGLLDAEAVRVMARDYDQIMATVARASAPVAEAYRRVQEEYGWLVANSSKGSQNKLRKDAGEARVLMSDRTIILQTRKGL